MGEWELPRGVTIHGGKLRITFTFRGVRCRESLGITPSKANIEFARRKRDIVLHEIAIDAFDYLAHFSNPTRAVMFGAPTINRNLIGDLLDRWMRGARLAYSTRQDYGSAIERYLKPKWGRYELGTITSSAINEWLAGLSLGNKRKNNILIPLRGALATAASDGLITRSPLENVRNLPVHTDDPDPMSPHEVQLLLGAISNAEFRDFVQFAIWTGLRTGELIALAVEDIDLEKGIIRVHRNSVRRQFKSPKTKAGTRNVILLDDARTAVTRQLGRIATRAEQPVIHTVDRMGEQRRERFTQLWRNPSSGEPWANDQQIRRTAWEPAIACAGIPHRTPYQCRHTYASMLLSWDANPMFVAQQMGHADWGMIRARYGRWIRSMNDVQLEMIIEGRERDFGPKTA